MKRETSLRDIARSAGVSVMTVSLALRDDPSISAATKEKVQALAREMNYRPKAVLASLLSDMRKGRGGGTVFAWINRVGEKGRTAPWFRHYLEGAQDQSDKFGFKLEVFDLGAGMTERRLSAILVARGIQGLIIGPFGGRGHLRMDWDSFSAVAASQALWRPELHRVMPNCYHNMEEAIRAARYLQYKRIGLYLSPYVDRQTMFLYSSRFYRYQADTPKKHCVPLLYEARLPGTVDTHFVPWVKEHKPEVIICHTRECIDWLKQGGYSVPEDVGLIHLMHTEDVQGWAGIKERHEEVGRASVELLLSLLTHREMGVPKIPREIGIAGTWVNGATVRRV